ncbi:hypothetical protein CW304_12000 [Bacillus sp. UFRGS-B20]|nr:hypothetical protein CW304_12000 [Bacillus sp. UFRGS-B20]
MFFLYFVLGTFRVIFQFVIIRFGIHLELGTSLPLRYVKRFLMDKLEILPDGFCERSASPFFRNCIFFLQVSNTSFHLFCLLVLQTERSLF